jgi:5-hydroxyisourate hydrolase
MQFDSLGQCNWVSVSKLSTPHILLHMGSEVMGPSARVIDGVYGRPAIGISVRLVNCSNGDRTEEWRGRTDEDGRVTVATNGPSDYRVCRLIFDINGYFATLGTTPLYPDIEISLRKMDSVSRQLMVVITPASYAIFMER